MTLVALLLAAFQYIGPMGTFAVILAILVVLAHVSGNAIGTALRAIHDWTFLLGPNFMLGINTIMYSFLFFRSGLVPRWLATLGMAGATLVFVAALLELFGVIEQISLWGALLSIPVALNEMSLAVWLLARGFNTPKSTSDAPRTPANELLRPA